MLPVGNPGHNHVRCVLNAVVGFDGGPAANGQANNGHETKSVATTILSTSATPLSTSSLGRRATASPSKSASAARGRGLCATTPWVVTSPEIPTPIPLAFP